MLVFLKLIIFIDDLNTPVPDTYGTHPALELIRQLLDLGGIYDTEKKKYVDSTVFGKVLFMLKIVAIRCNSVD